MINIFNKLDDLACTEHWDKEDEMKDILIDTFNTFADENKIEFTWLSDSHVAVVNESEEYAEDDLNDLLEEEYENFIDALETSNSEDED